MFLAESDMDYTVSQSQIYTDDLDKLVFFGPLSANLSDLFEMGFSIKSTFSKQEYRNNRKVKVFLQRGADRYRIAYLPAQSLKAMTDLTALIKSGANLERHKSNLNTRDPFDVLNERYPVKRKPAMIGNATLAEFIAAQFSPANPATV